MCLIGNKTTNSPKEVKSKIGVKDVVSKSKTLPLVSTTGLDKHVIISRSREVTRKVYQRTKCRQVRKEYVLCVG